jgi:general secretion pathway protein D
MKSLLAIGAAALLALPFAAAAQDSAPSAGASLSRASSSEIDLGDLIARYAKRSGKQFIIDPRVHGQAPLAGMDPDRITYEKLLAILSVHQVVAVPQGDWIIVEPDANARQLATPVYTDRNFKSGAPDDIATLVVTVKNICAAQAVPVLRPLMPQSAHMAAFTDTNALILSDHVSNLHRLVTVLEALERSGEKSASSVGDCQARFEGKSAAAK